MQVDTCPICLHELPQLPLECGHTLCGSCFSNHSLTRCPLCRRQLKGEERANQMPDELQIQLQNCGVLLQRIMFKVRQQQDFQHRGVSSYGFREIKNLRSECQELQCRLAQVQSLWVEGWEREVVWEMVLELQSMLEDLGQLKQESAGEVRIIERLQKERPKKKGRGKRI